MKTQPKPDKKHSGNIYDRVFRENIGPIFIPFIERQLGIKIVHIKPLPDKMVTTLERETDALYQVKTIKHISFILHLQVQTRDDATMLYRVAEIHGMLLRKYKLPIRHVVLYLGEKLSKMRNKLPKREVFTNFELFSLNNMSATQLLNSKIPEEVILAILADYHKEQSDEIIRSILERLQILCEKDKQSMGKYASQLTILSKLRNLEPQTIQNIKTMPQLFDITTSILYKEGLEKGLEEGLEKGLEDLEKKSITLVANMLTMSEISVKKIADLTNVDITLVKYLKHKFDSGEWEHPKYWNEKEWERYFSKK